MINQEGAWGSHENAFCLDGGLCYTGIQVFQNVLSGTFNVFHCMLILLMKHYKDFDVYFMHAEVFGGKVYWHLQLPLKWIKNKIALAGWGAQLVRLSSWRARLWVWSLVRTHLQEWTSESINRWNNKLMCFLSL